MVPAQASAPVSAWVSGQALALASERAPEADLEREAER
jgi:hypothetical protein